MPGSLDIDQKNSSFWAGDQKDKAAITQHQVKLELRLKMEVDIS